MLLKPLKYVFYRILAWKLRDKRESLPVLVAAGATVLLLFFNLIAAVMILNRLRGHDLLPDPPGGIDGLAVFLLFSLAVGYLAMRYAWLDKSGFVELRREFRSGGPRTDALRSALFWTYIVASGALPFILSICWRR
jgi:hypothetical protein